MWAREPSKATLPLSYAFTSDPPMTTVVVWSSFAVRSARVVASACAKDGSGRVASVVVAAAFFPWPPQPTSTSATMAAKRARRTWRSLEVDGSHSIRPLPARRTDDLDERGGSGRERDTRVHGDVAHDARVDPQHGAVEAAVDDVVGDERNAEARRREADGALRL